MLGEAHSQRVHLRPDAYCLPRHSGLCAIHSAQHDYYFGPPSEVIICSTFPSGESIPDPPAIPQGNACTGGETEVIAKTPTLVSRSTPPAGSALVLKAEGALEVDEGQRWANRPGHSEEPSEGVEVVALDRRSGHREEHLLVEVDAIEETRLQ